VPLHSGATIDARMPTPEERAAEGIDQGVPVFVVDGRVLPADRITLVVRHSAAAHRPSASVEPT
jgi:hypothetical protein